MKTLQEQQLEQNTGAKEPPPWQQASTDLGEPGSPKNLARRCTRLPYQMTKSPNRTTPSSHTLNCTTDIRAKFTFMNCQLSKAGERKKTHVHQCLESINLSATDCNN